MDTLVREDDELDYDVLNGLRNAWLSPEGRLVTYHDDMHGYTSFHEELAMYIMRDMFNLETKLDALDLYDGFNVSSATEYFEDNGWIRLHGFGGMTPTWVIPPGYNQTNAQNLVILDWCLVNKRSYYLSLNRCGC